MAKRCTLARCCLGVCGLLVFNLTACGPAPLETAGPIVVDPSNPNGPYDKADDELRTGVVPQNRDCEAAEWVGNQPDQVVLGGAFGPEVGESHVIHFWTGDASAQHQTEAFEFIFKGGPYQYRLRLFKTLGHCTDEVKIRLDKRFIQDAWILLMETEEDDQGDYYLEIVNEGLAPGQQPTEEPPPNEYQLTLSGLKIFE